jgi:hypothetical protein
LIAHEWLTPAVTEVFSADASMVVWWGTEIECHSAIARKTAALLPDGIASVEARLEELRHEWHEVQPAEAVRRTAVRIVRTHDLRAADALQLAAAIAIADDDLSSLPFVTLDDRLAQAAARERLPVIRPER